MNQLVQLIITSIISAMLSGIVATVITLHSQKLEKKHALKYEVFQSFVGNRFNITGERFTTAVNQIPVVFSDSDMIIKIWKDMLDEAVIPSPSRQGDSMNRKILALYKAMAKDLKINITELDDADFLRCFNNNGSSGFIVENTGISYN